MFWLQTELVYLLPARVCETRVNVPRSLRVVTLSNKIILDITQRRFLDFFYSRTPLIRNQVIPKASYTDRVDPSGRFVENSTALTCLEITGYRIKYTTVLWLVELQIRRGRKV